VDSPLLETVAGGDRNRVAALLREVLGRALSPQVLEEITREAFQENRAQGGLENDD
jgi:hypothetical protein